MTERTGGSDVGPSETIAKRNADGSYSITGFKFFTSATTSPVTFMLARIVDDNGQSTVGSRGTQECFLHYGFTA
jgi:alkylation response protein AidB-like acyl-CoA dehydrogenase